jgi:superkiller protein 3
MSYRANIVLVTAIAILAPAPFALADSRAEAQGYYNQGISLKKSGDVDAALVAFEAAVKIEPKFTAAHYSIGLIHKKKGDFEKAKKALNNAISSSAEYGPAHLSLGQILLQEGAFEDCRKEFNLAIKGKEMTSGDKAESYNGIGISYRYESKIPDAVKAFDEAISLDSKNWIYYVNKGIAINKSKDKTLLPEGEKAYRKAAELAPDKAEPWIGIGINCRKQGKFDEAIAGYEKGLSINPKDTDAWYDLASMYMKKENYDKALTAWEAYVKLAKPGSQSAQDAEAYIQQLKKKLGKQ